MLSIETNGRRISGELAAFVAACATVVACSSSSGPDNSTQGGARPTGGSIATSVGVPSSGGARPTGGSIATSGGVPSSGGGSALGGTATSGGSSSLGGVTGGLGGATGSMAGTGGGTPSVSGGSSTGGAGLAGGGAASGGQGTGGGSGSGGAGGPAGGSSSGGDASGGASGAGGATPDIACPVGATFCSGFEGSAFPSGTQFHSVGPSSPNPYLLDTAQFFKGKQSLGLPMGSEGFYYRALAVPIPGQNFWVRLYVRTSTVFGDNGHDSLFGASTGAVSADLNSETLVEFSEQFDKVLLNTKDQLFQPMDTSTLTANAWHCVEAHYDGDSGDVQVFADGKEVIHATAYAKQSFKTFRLGLMQYHEARAAWFDDVVVAPMRVNCE